MNFRANIYIKTEQCVQSPFFFFFCSASGLVYSEVDCSLTKCHAHYYLCARDRVRVCVSLCLCLFLEAPTQTGRNVTEKRIGALHVFM